jgi:tRNA1Val (adenine37-N6)-methyltransferase
MAQGYFRFKQFRVNQERSAMKVTTPACLFGAWSAEKLSNLKAYKTALDIGTGTGLLSLMIAQQTHLEIDAVEIDADAAMEAEENFKASPFASIRLIKGDLNTSELPIYDVIFSNPPFYENELKSPDATRNIAHHSKSLSWEELFSFIKNHLSQTGKFFLLLPLKRLNDLYALAAANALYLNEIAKVKPSHAQPALWMMVEGGKEETECKVTEISIREGSDYTTTFTALLKDYYLNL